MIDKVMDIIRKEVNSYIVKKLNDTTITNRVALTSFVDENGRITIPADSVGLSLLNIEEEKTLKMAGLVQSSKAESLSPFVSPPISLYLQLMFTANFTNYLESLKHISYIMECLQTKPVFDAANTPDMNNIGIPQLFFEMNTLGLEQQHYIWAMIGLRYLPSVVYRVRTLMIFERDVVDEVPNIKEIITVPNLKEVND
jgi:hypothetical protein